MSVDLLVIAAGRSAAMSSEAVKCQVVLQGRNKHAILCTFRDMRDICAKVKPEIFRSFDSDFEIYDFLERVKRGDARPAVKKCFIYQKKDNWGMLEEEVFFEDLKNPLAKDNPWKSYVILHIHYRTPKKWPLLKTDLHEEDFENVDQANVRHLCNWSFSDTEQRKWAHESPYEETVQERKGKAIFPLRWECSKCGFMNGSNGPYCSNANYCRGKRTQGHNGSWKCFVCLRNNSREKLECQTWSWRCDGRQPAWSWRSDPSCSEIISLLLQKIREDPHCKYWWPGDRHLHRENFLEESRAFTGDCNREYWLDEIVCELNKSYVDINDASIIALCVGISNYKHAQQLNTSNDALLFAEKLSFCEGARVSLLIGSYEETIRNALGNSIKAFVKELEQANSKKLKLIFFHYAGHAMQLGNTIFLLGSDAEIDTFDDLQFHGIDFVDEARKICRAAPDVHKIFVLDCCRDFPERLRDTKDMHLPNKSAVDSSKHMIHEKSGFIFSATAGGKAGDGSVMGCSPFAETLSKHLFSPGKSCVSAINDACIEVADRYKSNKENSRWDRSPAYQCPIPSGIWPKESLVLCEEQDFGGNHEEKVAVQGDTEVLHDKFRSQLESLFQYRLPADFPESGMSKVCGLFDEQNCPLYDRQKIIDNLKSYCEISRKIRNVFQKEYEDLVKETVKSCFYSYKRVSKEQSSIIMHHSHILDLLQKVENSLQCFGSKSSINKSEDTCRMVFSQVAHHISSSFEQSYDDFDCGSEDSGLDLSGHDTRENSPEFWGSRGEDVVDTVLYHGGQANNWRDILFKLISCKKRNNWTLSMSLLSYFVLKTAGEIEDLKCWRSYCEERWKSQNDEFAMIRHFDRWAKEKKMSHPIITQYHSLNLTNKVPSVFVLNQIIRLFVSRRYGDWKDYVFSGLVEDAAVDFAWFFKHFKSLKELEEEAQLIFKTGNKFFRDCLEYNKLVKKVLASEPVGSCVIFLRLSPLESLLLFASLNSVNDIKKSLQIAGFRAICCIFESCLFGSASLSRDLKNSIGYCLELISHFPFTQGSDFGCTSSLQQAANTIKITEKNEFLEVRRCHSLSSLVPATECRESSVFIWLVGAGLQKGFALDGVRVKLDSQVDGGKLNLLATTDRFHTNVFTEWAHPKRWRAAQDRPHTLSELAEISRRSKVAIDTFAVVDFEEDMSFDEIPEEFKNLDDVFLSWLKEGWNRAKSPSQFNSLCRTMVFLTQRDFLDISVILLNTIGTI